MTTTPSALARSAVARLVASAVLTLSIASCGTTPAQPEKKPEDQLFDARQEYRQTLDGLYKAYGGTDVPGNPGPTPPTAGSPESSSTGGDMVGHVVSEADRSYFERQCLAVGRGERPFSVSAKMQRFLDGPENAKGCRKAAQLADQIRHLEERVGKS